MVWELERHSEPKASKDYDCEASVFLEDTGYGEDDFEKEEWLIIEKARSEGFKILKGTVYDKLEGKWEGDWAVFRSRQDINGICLKYGFYPDN